MTKGPVPDWLSIEDHRAVARSPITGAPTPRGRQKGAKAKLPSTVTRVFGRVTEKAFTDKTINLDRLVLEAQVALRKSIRQGDVQASTWLLDRTQGRIEQASLRTALDGADFTSMDGVLSAAARLMDMMASGALPLGQVEKAQNIIRGYAQLRMVDELERLEDLLKAIENKARQGELAPTQQPLPDHMLPSWGRLRNGAIDVEEASGVPAPHANGKAPRGIPD